MLHSLAMNVSLIQAASALNANVRWQELIAENLAASSNPGYRKQDLSFEAVKAGVMAPNNPTSSNAASPFYLPVATQVTNFSQGQMMYTGVATNMAIEGNGFFQVQKPDGEQLLTRNGEFDVNSAGQLINKNGYLVLSDSGPIQIDRSNPAPITIAPTGEIKQGEAPKGKVSVVEVNDTRYLSDIGGGCYSSNNPNLQMTESEESTVKQYFLESANTTPVKEMAGLITAMRTYEVNQRIIQLNDERMSRSISELGNQS
jgi:flagellar basal body rod protein FlgG